MSTVWRHHGKGWKCTGIRSATDRFSHLHSKSRIVLVRVIQEPYSRYFSWCPLISQKAKFIYHSCNIFLIVKAIKKNNRFVLKRETQYRWLHKSIATVLSDFAGTVYEYPVYGLKDFTIIYTNVIPMHFHYFHGCQNEDSINTSYSWSLWKHSNHPAIYLSLFSKRNAR